MAWRYCKNGAQYVWRAIAPRYPDTYVLELFEEMGNLVIAPKILI